MTSIAIIDYQIGNISSIYNAFDKERAKAFISRDESEILAADGVVLPGVGAFAYGMMKLEEHNLVNLLHRFAQTNKPILGICLGMQMLFDKSSEFTLTDGLGLIPGEVVGLNRPQTRQDKLPNIGWSELHESTSEKWGDKILYDIQPDTNMYFVHSFIAIPKDKEDMLTTSDYVDQAFCSTVKHGNIYGCQYHPEKSATEGLKIIKNFINICKENRE